MRFKPFSRDHAAKLRDEALEYADKMDRASQPDRGNAFTRAKAVERRDRALSEACEYDDYIRG